MLSSCQQEETPDVILPANDRRIVFRASLPELSSRAEVVTSNLPSFNLTAFDESDDTYKEDDGTLTEYFSDELIEEKATGTEMFVSDQCIWPKPGQEDDLLHFFAYYPELPTSAKLENTSTAVGDQTTIGYKINDYTIAENIADQIDFITAYTTGTMDLNQFSGINLEFKHQLSRVEVMAKGSSKTFKLEIAGVRFGEMPTQGNFTFQMVGDAGSWTDTKEKKVIEYIYGPGDKIVSINNSTTEASIMGSGNYAMLIPSEYAGWDYLNDATNTGKGMYLSVLLRVLDKTPTGKDKQQYPYYDNSQGLNAMSIPRVLLEIDNNGNVKANHGQVYKNAQGQYFTDAAMTEAYTVPAGSTVKEFGWATLPVTADWKAGYTYTYTLDYTYGVGLHGPEVPGEVTPKSGDPIISDRVGVSLGFKDWTNGASAPVTVPGN